MNHRTALAGAKLLSGVVVLAAVAAAAPRPPAAASRPSATAPRPSAAPKPPAAGGGKSWENYRLLNERNIFLRNRRRWRPPRAASTPPIRRVVFDSDRDIALTGISRRDGEYVAFFEHIASGATTRMRVGEVVGKGRIKAITLDGIEYERGDFVSSIQIGRTLTGAIAAIVVTPTLPTMAARPAGTAAPSGPPRRREGPTTASTQPTTQPGAAPAPSPSGGGKDDSMADILKRMRERRDRELRR
jgi:hypothetical protein